MRQFALSIVALAALTATSYGGHQCRNGRCFTIYQPPIIQHQVVPMDAIEYVPKVHRGYEIRSRRRILGWLFPRRQWVPAAVIEGPDTTKDVDKSK